MNSIKLQLIFLMLALSACMNPSAETLARRVPILAAAIDCETEEIKTLAEGLTPADLAQRDSIGRAVLHWAIVEGCDAGVEILLEAGAYPNQASGERSSLGDAPLNLATGTGRIAMVRSLLAHGADPHVSSGRHHATSLFGAAGSGNPELLRVMLGEGLEASERDLSGETPLHHGAWHPETARILLENGADVNARANGGATPLFWVSGPERGDAGASIRALLAEGADLHARTSSGTTVLMSAVARGNPVAVRAFLQAGAAVNAQDGDGQTALAMVRDERRQWREGFFKLMLRVFSSDYRDHEDAKLAVLDEIETLLLKAGARA